MSTIDRKTTWIREELLHLLSLSGTLAGLSITGVAVFRAMDKASMATTIAGDLLALTNMVASGFMMVYTVM